MLTDNPWRTAIEEALIAQGMDLPAPDADPKDEVQSLVDISRDWALDPAVSAGARVMLEDERMRCAMVVADAMLAEGHIGTRLARAIVQIQFPGALAALAVDDQETDPI
jgi:hypothetical protein